MQSAPVAPGARARTFAVSGMTSGKRLTRNALMAVAQVVVSGGVLFLLYRYLLRAIGSDQLGLWSLVLAAASASRIGEIGLTASAVKYTAKYLARGEECKVSEVIQTTAIAIGVMVACVLVAGYPLIAWLLERTVPAGYIPDALAVVPYAMASAWIATLAAVYLSALDGCQRIDLRAQASMLSSVLLLMLAWLLVPRWGLIGLAWAQIGQAVATLLGSWVLLRGEVPSLSLSRRNWNFSRLREMFRYGFNFQVISIFGMLVDPVIKALMTKFGGLTPMAYFEMANRMVAQFRALPIAANQVVVPQVATLHENAPEDIGKVYLDSYRAIFFLALPMYAGLVAVAPLVSELWIGHYEQDFVTYAALVTMAYLINTLAGPAYFVNLGTGHLRWNTWSFVVTAALNGMLGYWLGSALGGTGVVWGYALGTVAGSALVIVGYHRDQGMPFTLMLPAESRALLMACCLGLAATWISFDFLGTLMGPLAQAALSSAACAAVILPMLWVHPLGERIRSGLVFHS